MLIEIKICLDSWKVWTELQSEDYKQFVKYSSQSRAEQETVPLPLVAYLLGPSPVWTAVNKTKVILTPHYLRTN